MMNIFLQGLLLQASLILALGAQNLFLIEVSLKRNNHVLAATICAVCDMLLIILGVLGVSALLVSIDELKISIGLIGALFLAYYAGLKFKEACKGISSAKSSLKSPQTKKSIILATLSFTLLNPHVYIDTFFLVGGYSTRFDSQINRFAFGLGAGFFSIIWFYFLALFASRFSRFLTRERNLRITSFVTGLILSYLAIGLGTESVRNLQAYFQ